MYKTQILILFIFFVFKAGNSLAQQASSKETLPIDSVKKLMLNTNVHDTIRLLACMDYADKASIIRIEFWDSLSNVSQEYVLLYETNPKIKKALQKIQGEALNNHGYFCKKNGLTQLALNSYKKSIGIREEIKDYKNLASTYTSMGILSIEMGELAQGHEYLQKSLELRTMLNDQNGIVNTLNSLGGLYQEQYNFNKALEYYEKSLTIARQLKQKEAMANTLDNIGVAYIENNEYSKALLSFEEALVLWRELNETWGMAYCYANMGGAYIEQKNYDKAKECFEAAKDRFMQVKSKKGMTSSLLSFGRISYLEKDFKTANNYFTEALVLSKETGNSEDNKNATRWLYRTQIQLNQPDKALPLIGSVMKKITREINNNYFTFPEREKEIYFTRLEDDFMRYYDFAHVYQNKYPALADTCFNFALRNKGLLLKSAKALIHSIHKSKDTSLLSSYSKWVSLKKEISKLYAKSKNTIELEEQAATLEQKIIKKSTLFNEIGTLQQINWKQIQHLLKNQEAVIEFIQYKRRINNEKSSMQYAALVLLPNQEHVQMIPLCSEDDLIKTLGKTQATNKNYVEQLYGSKNLSNGNLYQLLWKPLESQLNNTKTIYYSPTGLLHKIAFSAICNPTGVYLSKQFTLYNMSSTSALVLNSMTALSEKESYLLIGGVNYDTDSTVLKAWNYLPGTLAETDAIQKQLTKKKKASYVLNGNQASEEEFKQNATNYNVLHIATHGYFYPNPETLQEVEDELTESPNDVSFRGGGSEYVEWNFVSNKNPLMRSGLILAGANNILKRNAVATGEDGILTAQEVSNLDFENTRLVVLSACETGLGDIKGSEGVYGLQRAFKMAGVDHLIISLWQVPDKETAEFMQLFYNELLHSKKVETAFLNSQLSMQKKYDPYFWAAFVLVR